MEHSWLPHVGASMGVLQVHSGSTSPRAVLAHELLVLQPALVQRSAAASHGWHESQLTGRKWYAASACSASLQAAAAQCPGHMAVTCSPDLAMAGCQ